MKTDRKTKDIRMTLLLLFSLLFLPAIGWTLPAFPGAEGFGSTTIGGRGGTVIEVTNTNASGAGSLAAAIAASGPRIVVFRTGGTITLTNALQINNPFITIAGQTAPGGGIALRGAMFIVHTHDVIVRNLRIRIGDSLSGPDPGTRDGLDVQDLTPNRTYNVIIDHCSVSWGIDENIDVFGYVHDVTVMQSISSEGLYDSIHPAGVAGRGMLLGDQGGMYNISLHHNLIASNLSRDPTLGGDRGNTNVNNTEVINNVTYNWRNYAMRQDSGRQVAHWIGNYLKAGPDSTTVPGLQLINLHSAARAYVSHNIGPGRPTDSGDDWLFVDGSTSFRSLTPLFTASGITVQSPTAAYDTVLASAGATAPQRDVVDNRVIQGVKNGTGQSINSQNQVGGWPTLAAGTPPQDTDHDGMPDAWETSHGLNLNSASDGSQDRDSDGYTNVEEYINSLLSSSGGGGGGGGGSVPNPPSNLNVS